MLTSIKSGAWLSLVYRLEYTTKLVFDLTEILCISICVCICAEWAHKVIILCQISWYVQFYLYPCGRIHWIIDFSNKSPSKNSSHWKQTVCIEIYLHNVNKKNRCKVDFNSLNFTGLFQFYSYFFDTIVFIWVKVAAVKVVVVPSYYFECL